ncbi:hypothetical protein CVT24_011794 [Panaeolus cyanescens]|uniref:Uncharacterized protein n=1 Tax=Panaeolus cyanescens TaxID=181874 RepID=A0A409X5Y0_9AGAR|nr:hypothetical protein CVT24_011794 [Panaeolus cyanescens]
MAGKAEGEKKKEGGDVGVGEKRALSEDEKEEPEKKKARMEGEEEGTTHDESMKKKMKPGAKRGPGRPRKATAKKEKN